MKTASKILELLEKGYTAQAIMSKLKVGWSTVAVIAKTNGYQERTVYRKWKDIEEETKSLNSE